MKEYRLCGPPGTGKTETLRRAVEATAAKHGADRLLVSSFTKAAAREIASRVDLPEDRVGTLHAHCFRALGKPTIAEGKIAEWNERVGGNRLFALSGARADVDDPYSDGDRRDPDEFGGDVLFEQANLARARLLPPERWKPAVRAWYEQWRGWLDDAGYVDFTGLLEQALALVDFAPGDPAVLFADECQDNSPLEFALLRKWAARCEVGFYLAGDPAQTIYGWRGASPETFFNPPLPPEQYRHLEQSYRLPRAVLDEAERWLHRSSDARLYASRRFAPRREDPKDLSSPVVAGAVHEGQGVGRGRFVGRWNYPDDLLQALVEDAERTGETVAILASCDYLLTPTLGWLRNHGVPFHNPLRVSNGRWNPMRGGTERLRDFLVGPRPDLLSAHRTPDDVRMWTWQEFKRWSELLPADGFLRRGARTQVEARVRDDDKLHRQDVMTLAELRTVLAEGIFEQLGPALASDQPWKWLQVRVAPKKRAAVDFALNVVHHRGPRALRESPKVVVGTCHCSPPDELVLTRRGQVPIAELREDDRLVCYQQGTNSIHGWKPGKNARGYAFKRSVRPHIGVLVRFETSVGTTRVTPEHRVMARFADSFLDRWCVYLMKRGSWWRVGICTTAKRPYVAGGISGRLSTEQGDCAWLLSVHDTREEALYAEAATQTASGVTGLRFEVSSNSAFTREQLHAIHGASSAVMGPRAAALLEARGLLAHDPLYIRSSPAGIGRRGKRAPGDISKRNMRGNFLTSAANLRALSGRIEMLTFAQGDVLPRGMAPIPRLAKVSAEPYIGNVYGLDVPPHHCYVSGGACVHNSVKGGGFPTVAVFPDLSPSGYAEWDGSDAQKDAVRRVFYVAMSRASQTLVLAGAASQRAVDWNQ